MDRHNRGILALHYPHYTKWLSRVLLGDRCNDYDKSVTWAKSASDSITLNFWFNTAACESPAARGIVFSMKKYVSQ